MQQPGGGNPFGGYMFSNPFENMFDDISRMFFQGLHEQRMSAKAKNDEELEIEDIELPVK